MISAPDPMSFTAPMSSWAGPGPSLTSAAASRAAAPLDTAMATASVSADTRSDGRATAAAAYVRPVSSLTAAPSADPTRALAERARVMIFRSSGPSSASVTRPSLLRRRVAAGRFAAGRWPACGRVLPRPAGGVLPRPASGVLRGPVGRTLAVAGPTGRTGRRDVAIPRPARVRLLALRTVALRTVALRTVALRPLALRTVALRTVALRPGSLGGIHGGAVPAEPLDGDGADPVAPASHTLGGQPQARHGRRGAGDRHPAEPLRKQSADGLHILGLDPNLEQLGQLVHRQPRRHPGVPIAEPLDRRLLPVVLVCDLANDLLQDVLDRHQSGRAAILVDHDGHVRPPGLHLP